MRRGFTLLLLLAIGFAVGSTRAQQQDPQKPAEPAEPAKTDQETISLETNLVTVNVTITDAKDRYVSGLKSTDFQILEDNKRQQILSFGFEETAFATVILLDASGSMERKLTLERAACANFVDGLRPGDVFSIYSFGGTKVKKLQDFREVRDISDAVWDLRAEGNTPLYDGIVQAAEALSKRPERRRAILIVSDGVDTQSRASLDQATRQASNAQVAIYSVDMSDATVYGGPSRDNSANVMKSLAGKTGGQFFPTPGGAKLREAFANIVDELRNQYTLTYASSNEREDGRWRAITVQISRPSLNVRTRQGYYARRKRA